MYHGRRGGAADPIERFPARIGRPLRVGPHVVAERGFDRFMPHKLFLCTLADKLRTVQGRLNQLQGLPRGPEVFENLGEALERCIGSGRQTNPAVKLVKKYLDTLQDGVTRLQTYDAEVTAPAIAAVRDARGVVDH